MTPKTLGGTELTAATRIEAVREKVEAMFKEFEQTATDLAEAFDELGAVLQPSLEDQADLEVAKRVKADIAAGRDEALPSDVAKALLKGASPIRVYRKHRKLTQDQLAKQSGVDQATISDLENENIENPGVRTIKALAAALGVTIDDLVA